MIVLTKDGPVEAPVLAGEGDPLVVTSAVLGDEHRGDYAITHASGMCVTLCPTLRCADDFRLELLALGRERWDRDSMVIQRGDPAFGKAVYEALARHRRQHEAAPALERTAP